MLPLSKTLDPADFEQLTDELAVVDRHFASAREQHPMRRWTAQERRFWEKVLISDACWLWTGSLHHNGYGQIAWLPSDPIKTRRAHCLSWVLNGGVLLSTRRVLHTCDVRHCVRWDHLYQGTPAHNSADMVRRGRAGKLRPEVVRAIRAAVGDAAVVARDFGLPHRTVYDIRTGRTWSALA